MSNRLEVHQDDVVTTIDEPEPPRLSLLSTQLLLHDRYTGEHSQRVTEYSVRVAQTLGLDAGGVELVRRAALLHDVGKLRIPAELLRSHDMLNERQRRIMRLHPDLGGELLARTPGLEDLSHIVRHHHERWDGLGYPQGLAGSDIPLESRIIFVADAFDAMTSQRPYGRLRWVGGALAELSRCARTQFDPLVVTAMYAAYGGEETDLLEVFAGRI